MRDRWLRGHDGACAGVEAIGDGKIFATHYLDHPYRGDTQVLGGWSYVWAGLFGPFYLLANGFARAQLATSGHFMGEGECPRAQVAPSGV